MTWTTRSSTLWKPITSSSGVVGSNACVNLDITSLLNGEGTYAVALTMATADGVTFAGNQSDHPPSVIITTQP